MNRVVKIVLGVLLVAAIAGGSFYGGMVYGKSQAQAALPGPGGVGRQQFGQGQAGLPGFPGGAGEVQSSTRQGGTLFGEILTISGNDLTVKDESGQETTVHVTDTTLIQKQAEVTVADLAEGETVVVSGSRGEDGSITARMVQSSPAGGGFFGRAPGAEATPGVNP